MDKMVKKLTDRELIDVVLAWYELDQSTEELREAVAVYVQQNQAKAPTFADPIAFEALRGAALDRVDANRLVSNADVPGRQSEPMHFQSNEVTYKPQFEPADELIGTRGWLIDVWALYYGTEEFFHRISFGLVSMQTLAVLFCILISAAVMIGAWQSNLSIERQKKATFKTMEFEQGDKSQKSSSSSDSNTQPQNNSIDTTEPLETPTNTIATSVRPSTIEFTRTEFAPAISIMKKGAWDDALAELQTLGKSDQPNLQPMLTLMKVEALIQKHDTVSMEEARQLLMDCRCGEFDTVYDLLVTRWMLLGGTEDRKRFLNESASLPDAARWRMSTWAHIRNGSKDAMTEVKLESASAKGQSGVCDLLFIASFHYNIGKYDETVRELLDTSHKLRALQATGKTDAENWLLETAKLQLVSKVEDILSMVNGRLRKQIN